MRLLPIFILLFFTFFTINIVNAIASTDIDEDAMYDEMFDVELTDTGNIEQKEIEVIGPEWRIKTYSEAYIYLAGYSGEITIDDEKYIPEAPSKCALVYVNTKNIAKRPVKQTYTTYLTDGDEGTLDVKVKVVTWYQVKRYKTVLGIRIPYYETSHTTEYYYKTFDAPAVFPAVEPPTAFVTYYRGSHAVVNVAYVDESGNEIPGIGKVDVRIPGSAAREYRLVGEIGTAENGFRSTRFEKVSTWKYTGKQMSRSQSGLWISEPFNIDNLTITVSTPYAKNIPVTDIEYQVVEDTSRSFLRLDFLIAIVYAVLYSRPFYLKYKRVRAKWYSKY